MDDMIQRLWTDSQKLVIDLLYTYIVVYNANKCYDERHHIITYIIIISNRLSHEVQEIVIDY